MHRTTPVLALLLAAAVAADEPAKALVFSKADLGKVPSGWKVPSTTARSAGQWKVQADKTAPSKSGFVLTQTASSPRSAFNLCVADSPILADVDIHVSFKALEGKADQGGGIVWRCKDAGNYYLARMNPLEDNFRLYRVVDGKRKQLETKEDLKVKAGTWHILHIRMIADQIECSLDGKKYLQAKDDTFKEKGKVGLWTKADARTSFDSFSAKSATR